MTESNDITVLYDNSTNYKSVIQQFELLNKSKLLKESNKYNSITDTFTKRAALYLEFCNFLKEGNKKSNFSRCDPSIIYNMIKTYYLDKVDSEREEALSPEYMINAIRLGEEKLRDERAQIYKRYCVHLESIRTKSSFYETHYTKIERWIDKYWTRKPDHEKDIRFNPDYIQVALSKALCALEKLGCKGIYKIGGIDYNFWKMHILHYSEAIEKGNNVWYTDKHKVETNQTANVVKERLRKLPIKDLVELENKLNAVALEHHEDEDLNE